MSFCVVVREEEKVHESKSDPLCRGILTSYGHKKSKAQVSGKLDY